jgi:uncharacterized protein YcfJ
LPLIYSCTSIQRFTEQKKMEIPGLTRIHPLMAAAAASVIIVSLTGAAAITGLLPTSKGAPDKQAVALVPAASPYALQAAPVGAPGMAPVAAPVNAPTAAYMPAGASYAQPAPVVQQEKPAVRIVEKTRVVHHHHTSQVARNDAPQSYQQQPAQPAAAQPNYVGIGTGAVIGGLIGNQIGGGNGKKLATVAGVIGGGFIGNEVANRNR